MACLVLAVAVSALVSQVAATSALNATYSASGGLSLTWADQATVARGFPGVFDFQQLVNGTVAPAPYGYTTTLLNGTFAAATLEYTLVYGWGRVSLRHTVSPTSLQFSIAVSNTNATAPILVLRYLFFGDTSKNVSALLLPGPLRADLPACKANYLSASDINAAYLIACPGAYPQAHIIDWGAGAASYVRTDSQTPPAVADPTALVINRNGYHLGAQFARIEPGATVSATFALRFGQGSGLVAPLNDSAPVALVADVLAATAAGYPYRAPAWGGGPIGAIFGSNPTASNAATGCNSSAPRDCPNPRGWTVGTAPINTTNPTGVAAFQAAMRAHVNSSVVYCTTRMGTGAGRCRGILFWALEGSEFSHPITYLGSPDQLHAVAPEMDAIADELMGMITRAGLRAGVVIRPQLLMPNPAWNATLAPRERPERLMQHYVALPDGSPDIPSIVAVLVSKIRYARARWNTSFYHVDSSVSRQGVLPHAVWEGVYQQEPSAILMPEWADLLDFSLVAPNQNDWGARPYWVSPLIKHMWPQAYGMSMMQFPVWAPPTVQQNLSVWAAFAGQGNAMVIQPWYDSPQNQFIRQAYEAAAAASVAPTASPAADSSASVVAAASSSASLSASGSALASAAVQSTSTLRSASQSATPVSTAATPAGAAVSPSTSAALIPQSTPRLSAAASPSSTAPASPAAAPSAASGIGTQTSVGPRGSGIPDAVAAGAAGGSAAQPTEDADPASKAALALGILAACSALFGGSFVLWLFARRRLGRAQRGAPSRLFQHPISSSSAVVFTTPQASLATSPTVGYGGFGAQESTRTDIAGGADVWTAHRRSTQRVIINPIAVPRSFPQANSLRQ
jgi:hypothetical protein